MAGWGCADGGGPWGSRVRDGESLCFSLLPSWIIIPSLKSAKDFSYCFLVSQLLA